MSKVARLPIALITAAIMLMTLVSAVAAAPASGARGSATALTDHAPEACVALEGDTAAALEADLMAEVDAIADAVVDADALAELRAQLELAAEFDGTACVDLATLTVYVDVCIADLEALADLLTDAELRAMLLDLLADVEVDAALELILDPLVEADVQVGDLIGELDLSAVTTDQLLDLVLGLQLELPEPVCVPLMVDIGDIVDLDEEIICVEITAITVLDFEVVFGDPALLDDALIAELAALLADLELEVGDVICVVLVPVDGEFVVGPIVAIVGGNVIIGDVIIGDITIGDCSNAVITIVVNGENVETNVTQNVEGQCVDVVQAPPAAPGTGASPAPQQPATGGAPATRLPNTGMTALDATPYGALLLALVALGSIGVLAYANVSARRSR